MPSLEVKDISVTYKNKKKTTVALDHLSATFSDGINVIVGYSGCGKSTLLKSLLGLVEYEGNIIMDGRDISELPTPERNFSFVSQEYLLYPMFTVFDNIAFPLKVMGAKKEEIKERVLEIAKVTDLTACLSRKPRHISGGQQQRVAIARALIRHPEVVLLDEPFSNVDAKARESMRLWLKNTLEKMDCMCVYVTHDLKEALLLADKLFVMDSGKIVTCGTPTEVFQSKNEIVETLKQGSETFA